MRIALTGSKARPSLRAVLYHHITNRVSSVVDRLAVSTPLAVFEAHMRKLARDYDVVEPRHRSLREAAASRPADHLRRRISLLRGRRRCPYCAGWAFPACCSSPGRASIPAPSRWTTCSRTSVRASAWSAWRRRLTPRARDTRTFLQLLDLVAAMPYGRFVQLGDELADRFDVDQAALRAESGIFLHPQDLAGLAAARCEVANHTRSHLFCRSIPDEEVAARRSSSMPGDSSR